MKKTLIAFAAATALASVASVSMPTKADAQVFVYQDARYCFYFDGWHGPGWYRCGYSWRDGLGWGGVYGWHGWRNYSWERRGHRHHEHANVQRFHPRTGMSIHNGNRNGMTARGSTTLRSGTTGMGPARIHSGPSAHFSGGAGRSGGGAIGGGGGRGPRH